jgi:hypothetical protein
MRFLDEFVRVTEQMPCPICKHTDWCCVTQNGEHALCQRAASNFPYGEAGYIHRLGEPVQVEIVRRAPKQPRWTSNEIRSISGACFVAANIHYRWSVARSLGVSEESLQRLEVGMGRTGEYATFPMRDAQLEYKGIRYRFSNGKKRSLKGGSEGLFIPNNLGACRVLYIVEGPTDTAALLTMGLDAIGKPNCNGGTKFIVYFLATRPHTKVVIVSDNDAPDRQGRHAGQDGARKLAAVLRERVLATIMPRAHKDVREYLNFFAHSYSAARAIMTVDQAYWQPLIQFAFA